MSWVATAVAGTALVGDYIGSKASDKASKRGQEASLEAARIQAEAAQKAQDQAAELNAPYLDIGRQGIEQFQPFLDDPSGNTFLQGNPMFQAAVDYGSDRLENRGAAAGKFNSGGMVDQLFQNYLATGDQFVNSAYDRAFNPVLLGQNAANFQSGNASDLITGAGNANAAGVVGAANAYGVNKNNQAGFASNALGTVGGYFGNRPPALPPTNPGYNNQRTNYDWMNMDPNQFAASLGGPR